MANIGATTAFYKVETALTRANSEVSKSMERLATGKANANAGDRSSYVAMADTFRLDFVGTKAGIKGASVVMGYLETGMRVLDSASALLSRLQELAVQQGNGILNDSDRASLTKEAAQITTQIKQVIKQSSFNDKNLFQDASNNSSLNFQLGGKVGEVVALTANITADPIKDGLTQLDFSTSDPSTNLSNLESIQQVVSERRSELGAVSNRIDSSINQLTSEKEQIQSARSRIEDADIAELISQMVTERVKQQAQLAVQSQANASAENTLRLLS